MRSPCLLCVRCVRKVGAVRPPAFPLHAARPLEIERGDFHNARHTILYRIRAGEDWHHLFADHIAYGTPAGWV